MRFECHFVDSKENFCSDCSNRNFGARTSCMAAERTKPSVRNRREFIYNLQPPVWGSRGWVRDKNPSLPKILRFFHRFGFARFCGVVAECPRSCFAANKRSTWANDTRRVTWNIIEMKTMSHFVSFRERELCAIWRLRIRWVWWGGVMPSMGLRFRIRIARNII